MTTTTRRALAAAAGALSLLSLTACSSGSDASTAASTSTTATTAAATTAPSAGGGAADVAAYRDCMAQNGVTLPDFGGGQGTPPSGMPSGGARPSGAPGGPGGQLPAGVDQGAWDAARAACADLQPTGFPGGPGGPAANLDASALAAYASCLSDHGVTIASGTDGMRQLDRSDPTVAAAMDTCAPLLPVPSGAPSPAATSS
jgi:hypothetical protein